jgi:hypothetical protein
MRDKWIRYMVISLSDIKGLKRIYHPLVVKKVLKRNISIYTPTSFFFTDCGYPPMKKYLGILFFRSKPIPKRLSYQHSISYHKV